MNYNHLYNYKVKNNVNYLFLYLYSSKISPNQNKNGTKSLPLFHFYLKHIIFKLSKLIQLCIV